MRKLFEMFSRKVVSFFAASENRTVLVLLTGILGGNALQKYGVFAMAEAYPIWGMFKTFLAFYVVLVVYTTMIKMAKGTNQSHPQNQQYNR